MSPTTLTYPRYRQCIDMEHDLKRICLIAAGLALLLTAPTLIALAGQRSSGDPMHVLTSGQSTAAAATNLWQSDPPTTRESLTLAENATLTLSIDHASIDADVCPTPVLHARFSGSIPNRCILAWRRDGDPTTYSTRGPVSARQSGDAMQLTVPHLATEQAWTGRIASLQWRLGFDAPPSDPLTITSPSVGVPRAVGVGLLSMLWRQWWFTEPLSLSTINTIRAPHVLGRSPATWLAALLAMLCGAWILASVLRRRPIHAKPMLAAAVVAWMAFDARHWHTPLHDHSASALVATPDIVALAAQLANSAMPPGAVYAVAGGNLPTAAGDSRLRYLLAPKFVQINVDPLHPRVAPQRAMFVIVLDQQAIRLDLGTNRLELPGAPPMVVGPWGQSDRCPYILQRVDR